MLHKIFFCCNETLNIQPLRSTKELLPYSKIQYPKLIETTSLINPKINKSPNKSHSISPKKFPSPFTLIEATRHARVIVSAYTSNGTTHSLYLLITELKKKPKFSTFVIIYRLSTPPIISQTQVSCSSFKKPQQQRY